MPSTSLYRGFFISSITVAIFVRASAVEFKLSQVKLNNKDKLV